MPTKVHKRKKPPATFRTCEYCSKVLASAQALKTHRNIHTGQKPFKCNLCDFAAVESKTLTCHVRQHTGETPYKCRFSGCRYQAKSSTAVKLHFARVHSDLKPFMCSLCPYKSKLNTQLNTHRKLWHREKSPSSSSSEFKPFPCDSCDQKYTSQGNLNRHQKKQHQNSAGGKGENEKVLQSSSCNLCYTDFKNPAVLLIHMRAKHTMEKPYICALKFPSCNYSSVSRPGLTSHQLRVHDVRKPKDGAETSFKCENRECNYESKTKAGLKIHEIVHKTQRDFHCPFENCTLAFKTKRGLKNHVKNIHQLAEKPFKCALFSSCRFSTKTKSMLTLHQKALHSTAGEKSALMLSCPFPNCQHKTLQRSNLKTHIKSHTNEKLYECDICQKKFLHKGALTSHKLMHEDTRNFPCRLCSYRGRSAKLIKEHIRGHTKEKLFL